MNEPGNLITFLKGLTDIWTDLNNGAGVITAGGGVCAGEEVDVLPVGGIDTDAKGFRCAQLQVSVI
jgi:hypothetical protein